MPLYPITSLLSKPSSGGGGTSFPSSVCFDVDATDSDSYGGSGQTWANLIASPADSELQTAYDFMLGTTSSPSTDDPTFTGSAGDSGAYFLFDGGDEFQIENGNTTTIQSFHKDNAQFWIAVAMRKGGTANYYHWGTTNNSNQTGVTLFMNATTTLVRVLNGSSVVLSSVASITFTNDTNYVIILSVDEGNAVNLYVNGTKYNGSAATYSSPSAGDAAGDFDLGATSNTNRYPNTTRLYAASMGNAPLTDDEAADIRQIYIDRHGRNYDD